MKIADKCFYLLLDLIIRDPSLLADFINFEPLQRMILSGFLESDNDPLKNILSLRIIKLMAQDKNNSVRLYPNVKLLGMLLKDVLGVAIESKERYDPVKLFGLIQFVLMTADVHKIAKTEIDFEAIIRFLVTLVRNKRVHERHRNEQDIVFNGILILLTALFNRFPQYKT